MSESDPDQWGGAARTAGAATPAEEEHPGLIPSGGGSYRIETVVGPSGPLALYHFAYDEHRTGRRLLVLKLDHYGDFLIGLPALRRLRKSFADDHITLVCGSWNVPLATELQLADEIYGYDFFPKIGTLWTGEPFESIGRFRQICRGIFDIAIDLRVDDDTRGLLKHVPAALKCGIGPRSRHPFLNVVLPAQFERRYSGGQWLLIEPDQFQSRMPRRLPLFHENDFSVCDAHLIYGPYVTLPQGPARAHFGVQLRHPSPDVTVTVDVARDGGEIIGLSQVTWTLSGDPRNAVVEFVNDQIDALYEFRVHARGRPIGLRFYGVRLELCGQPEARLKPSELHIGEQLSLLVDLLEQRTRVPAGSQIVKKPANLGSQVRSDSEPDTRRIVVAPLTNSRLRNWGTLNYARLVALLLQRLPCQIVLIGSTEQRVELEKVVDHNSRNRHIINTAGSASWSQTGEILAGADLVICGNSGVAHLAAACGTPILAIYSGSHQPQEWGPRGNNVYAMMASVSCSPCGYDRLEECPNDHLCMKQITPETIADYVVMILTKER